MAQRIESIRTTAFRLLPEHFGTVHVYRPGERFLRVWEHLEDQWRRSGNTSDQSRLPYRSLATALRVLSGDFVALQRRVGDDRAFIISRRPIPPEDLASTIGAWEVYALGMMDEPVGRVVDDLDHVEVEVANHIQHREGLCPKIDEGTNWVWDVGIWEVAHRLTALPLETDDGPMRLRLDSDAALLTWDNLVEAEGKGNSGAMHKLVLNLMTVPGVEEPVVSIQSSLVRLAPSWRETGGARYAWAALDGTAPLLRGRVRNKRDGASWATVWDDRAAEVLRGASLCPLPDTNGDPTLNGALRTGYARQPRNHAIGRGVGTWFHECVTHHAQKALAPEARCVELVSTRTSWPTQKTVASRLHLALDREEAELELRIFVVYASSAIRRRVRDALAHVLGEDAHEKDQASIQDFCEKLKVLEDDQPLRAGPVEVRFIKPTAASTWLIQRNARGRIEEWASSWLPSAGEEGVRAAAFMETNLEAATGKDDLADPKPVLRGILADRGIVTQFITLDSAPSSKPRRRKKTENKKFEDFAAANAVGDLLRSSGFFLRPFPEFGGGRGTVVVGIYGTRITKRITGRKAAYLTNLAAVELGNRNAWGFTDDNGWVPIDQATAWFLSNDQALPFDEAKQRVERAIGQLSVALDPERTILLVDAVGCRRFWPCLADKGSGSPEPWMRRDHAAVVRVRTATSEVPRPAGVGGWDQGHKPALHTDFRPMALQDAQGRAPTFVVSGSAVMSQGMSARKTTRLRASGTALQEDWHSLGTTELLVMEPGTWEAEALLEQVAMLCRVAPTWDRTLRWPSPLHLARAVVRDHPHGYFTDEEAEDVEDSRQLRFDIGING